MCFVFTRAFDILQKPLQIERRIFFQHYHSKDYSAIGFLFIF